MGPNVADSYYMCSKEENNSAFQLDVEQNMRMFRTGDIGRINLATNSLSIIDRQGFSYAILKGYVFIHQLISVKNRDI